jgi:hypothetical protein
MQILLVVEVDNMCNPIQYEHMQDRRQLAVHFLVALAERRQDILGVTLAFAVLNEARMAVQVGVVTSCKSSHRKL